MNENCLEHCPRIQAYGDTIDAAVNAAASSDPAHLESYAEHAMAIVEAGQDYLAAAHDSRACPNPTVIATNTSTGSREKAACVLVEYLCSVQFITPRASK